MKELKINDIFPIEVLKKIEDAAIGITEYCQNKDLTSLEFVYTLLHLLTSIKKFDHELNTTLSLIIDLYMKD